MSFWNKNTFQPPPSPVSLPTFGGALIAAAAGIHVLFLSKWSLAKKFSFRHSYLWSTSICFYVGGLLSLFLYTRPNQQITVTPSNCIDYNCAYILFSIGITFIGLCLIANVCKFTERMIINIKDGISKETKFRDKLIIGFCHFGLLLSETVSVLIREIMFALKQIKERME